MRHSNDEEKLYLKTFKSQCSTHLMKFPNIVLCMTCEIKTSTAKNISPISAYTSLEAKSRMSQQSIFFLIEEVQVVLNLLHACTGFFDKFAKLSLRKFPACEYLVFHSFTVIN